MNAIITKSEMAQAVDGVLATMNLTRADFGDQRDSAILDELRLRSELRKSFPASFILAQAANVARELEGCVRKVCCRCEREFFILAYLAPKPVFDRCGRKDCVQASAREV